jgi:cell division protein FtsL
MAQNRPKNIEPEVVPKKKLRFLSWFNKQNSDPSMRILPYFLYVAFFGIIYIANTHYSERNIRKINKLKAEVDEFRLDYTTLKSEYMLAGKRTEVAKRAAKLGIEESNKPAYKITPKKSILFGQVKK